MNSTKLSSMLLFSTAWIGQLPAQVKQEPKVNHNAAIVADFEKRVGEYSKLRKTQEQKLSTLKQTESQATIQGHAEGTAAGIKEARQAAKQGDIFTPEIADEFRRLSGVAVKGANGKRVTESLQNAEPVQLPLRVNEIYPANLPLQTTPPTLLMNLPKLPQDLEYRIVGRSLVLRDAKANLIVDYLPNFLLK